MTDPSLDQAFALIPSLKACSFDVFDTFLVRRSTGPEGVYEQTCRLLEQRTGRPLPVESFVQHRIKAEAKARLRAVEDRGAAEAGIAEIHALMPWRLFGLNPADIAATVETELDAEILLCRANNDMLELFQAMRSSGVRCGFISDTYWDRQQLGRLLAACAPELVWDFLFCSCESGTGKVDDLFVRYLAGIKVDPAKALHIGDNEHLDVTAAKRHGLHAHHYSQATAALSETFQNEDFLFRQICMQTGQSLRLDHGLRALRRAADKRLAAATAAESIGHRSIAPVLALFHAFIEKEVALLRTDTGKRVAVVFLGRDGFLSHQLWSRIGSGDGSYVEINRRVSLIASSADKKPICELITKIPSIDARAAKSILKFRHSHIDRFFAQAGKPAVPGREFAQAMRSFVDDDYIAGVATQARRDLIQYLSQAIPGFDSLTDIVLVDLGYSASIQKNLRRAFDLAGLDIRFHGRYLLTLDDDLIDIPATDSASGFISDLVVTPHTKCALLRNIAVIEQMFCAPDGSVLGYRNGSVQRETDPRPAGQSALCGVIRESAAQAAVLLHGLAQDDPASPFADTDRAAAAGAAILARLLLLPTEEELRCLGDIRHDVNLGTQATQPLIKTDLVDGIEHTHGLIGAFTGPEPPMWLAGSLAGPSSYCNLLYAMFSAGHLTGAQLADRPGGPIEIALIKGNDAQSVTVTWMRTATGTLRIRIPIRRSMNVSRVAIPVGELGRDGRVVGAFIQQGASAKAAMEDAVARRMTASELAWIGVTTSGDAFSDAAPDAAYLVLSVPADAAAITVLTVEIDIRQGTAAAARPGTTHRPQPSPPEKQALAQA